jgi:beta-phosphoglucomutase
MSRPLQAIVFDFDGVIANSEPLHLKAFQQALAEDGIALSAEEYYARYLGYDDVGLMEALARDRELPASRRYIAEVVALKGNKLLQMLRSGDVLFPGATEFIHEAARAVPIAIASGALRHEINEILDAADLRSLFAAVVASGDTPESKPSPAPYTLAFERLKEVTGLALDGRRCVAIEDSRWGLESARGAGLRCVGVTTSYGADELQGAELVVSGLDALTLDALDALCTSGAGHPHATAQARRGPRDRGPRGGPQGSAPHRGTDAQGSR